MNLTKTCKKAVKLWGADLQLNMAIEEASELIKAVCKLKRNLNADTVLNVAEEVADTEIMLSCRSEVESWKKYKLERLEQKIEEAESNASNFRSH